MHKLFYFILFSSAHLNLFTGEWMSQPHWSVSRQALVVLRAAHAGFSSVCVSPLRQSQLTVIIVRHNNGSGCSAGGQRSHCAIRPSQALADLCSQSSVALDKLARKKRQNLIIWSFQKGQTGSTAWTLQQNQMTKMRKDQWGEMVQKYKCQTCALRAMWTYWNTTPEGINAQLRFDTVAPVANAVVVLWAWAYCIWQEDRLV